MPAEAITLHCPCKINLALSVGSPQRDGMHPIASWMAAIDFGDTLQLTRLEPGEAPAPLAIRFADDAPRVEPIDWPLERDLAVRAHAA